MIYITGDPHRDFTHIKEFCIKNHSSIRDVMIVLGDAEINFYGDERDLIIKKELSKYEITFLCIHGNHEIRPQNLKNYNKCKWNEGYVLYEPYFPNILFAIDGQTYLIQNKKFLTIGGAFSITRLLPKCQEEKYWDDEQPSSKVIDKIISNKNRTIDYILTHTCPYDFIPEESCTIKVDKRKIDRNTEKRFQEIYNKLDFSTWFCGHYHTTKMINKMCFVYKNIIIL